MPPKEETCPFAASVIRMEIDAEKKPREGKEEHTDEGRWLRRSGCQAIVTAGASHGLNPPRRRTGEADAGHEDLVERRDLLVDDPAHPSAGRLALGPPSDGPRQTAVHSGPHPPTCSAPASRGRLAAAARRTAASAGGATSLISSSAAAEDDPALVDHRHAVGHPLDLVEQVRREQHRAAFLGDRADDRPQDVAADDRVEARRRLVEHQQFGPMGQGREQPGPRPAGPARGVLIRAVGSRSNACRSSSA